MTPQEVIAALANLDSPFILGQHYYVVNPVTGYGISPKWDFTSAIEAGHPDAFVVGARTGDVPAPTDPQKNIDWLSVSAVEGDLADQIFRIQTRGGQPPTSVSMHTHRPDVLVLTRAIVHCRIVGHFGQICRPVLWVISRDLDLAVQLLKRRCRALWRFFLVGTIRSSNQLRNTTFHTHRRTWYSDRCIQSIPFLRRCRRLIKVWYVRILVIVAFVMWIPCPIYGSRAAETVRTTVRVRFMHKNNDVTSCTAASTPSVAAWGPNIFVRQSQNDPSSW